MLSVDINKRLHGVDGEMNLDVKFTIKKHDFVALSGDSGSGKTTLLRILAGLDDAKGKIFLDDDIWLDDDTSLCVQERKIGFVFQDYALFPNMNVEENLLFVNKDKELANHLLSITELSELKSRHTNTLSGGQKQRVSLCRALMNRPKLLLMDEPFSAIDAKMRERLQREILILHKEFKTTTIMVSHDPSEIYKLSNRVIVLDKGKVINDGVPKDVLLKTTGSAKFSFEGELLDIVKADVIYIAIISIGQQIVEIVISTDEAKTLKIGQRINISTKAFAPNIKQKSF